jgi:hypothetical protein
MLNAKKCSTLAEREGFEPSVPVTQYARLAIWCLRPLGHLSAAAAHDGRAILNELSTSRSQAPHIMHRQTSRILAGRRCELPASFLNLRGLGFKRSGGVGTGQRQLVDRRCHRQYRREYRQCISLRRCITGVAEGRTAIARPRTNLNAGLAKQRRFDQFVRQRCKTALD